MTDFNKKKIDTIIEALSVEAIAQFKEYMKETDQIQYEEQLGEFEIESRNFIMGFCLGFIYASEILKE